MEAWIPLLQSLIWPTFIAVLLIVSRVWVRDMLETIRDRVNAGSEMSVGPSGFSLGSAPKLDQPTGKEESELLDKVDALTEDETAVKEQSRYELMQSVYLIHAATYFKQAGPTNDKRNIFTVKVILDADSSLLLDEVTKVVYYRHPATFKDKTILEVTDRMSNFEMVMRLWGQFNLQADVYFKNSEKPVTLFRFLNF